MLFIWEETGAWMLKGMKYDIYKPMFGAVCHRFFHESGSGDGAGRRSVISTLACKQAEMLGWCRKLSHFNAEIWLWASVLEKHAGFVSSWMEQTRITTIKTVMHHFYAAGDVERNHGDVLCVWDTLLWHWVNDGWKEASDLLHVTWRITESFL